MTLEAFLHSFEQSLSQGGIAPVAISTVAGVVSSAVCPCTLPVGLGMASLVGASEVETKKSGIKIASSFFAGIVLNLTLLGVIAGRLGVLLSESFGRYWTLVMAVISLIAAVVAFLGPRLKVSQLAAIRRPGALGAFLYGFVFSLGTSVAPLLLLLTVAASQHTIGNALVLAFAFGLGRGLPFLVVGLFAGALMRFTRLSLWRSAVQVASGIGLLVVSVYYAQAFVSLS